MLFLRILLLALCIMPSVSQVKDFAEKSSRVLEKCDMDSNCPQNSFCALRGCDGMVCICNIGHQPSEDLTECIKVVELYRSCADEESRCRGPLSFCEDTSKTCHCIDGYIPASDNIRCKKMPRYGLSFAMLGEPCKNDSIICQDTNQQVCSPDTSTCTCQEGLKPASNIDLNAEPFILDECRPADFSLEVELKECTKPVIIGIALIRQKCFTDNNCPVHSKCKRMGCNNKQCRCVNGTAPTVNMESCKPAVMLHRPCNNAVVCLGAYVGCIRGKCRCSHGSVEAIDNQCKSAPPIPDEVEFAVLGEKCNGAKKGQIMRLCESAVCLKGICHCPPSMREMSVAEILENPDVFPPCIPIHELSEELTVAEYEFRCLKKQVNLNRLNRTGVKPGVTARWAEEPQATSPFATTEDSQAFSEIEPNEPVTLEANEPDANSSVNLFEILVGKEANNTPTAEQLADRLSSMNDSITDEILNVSMGLNSANGKPSLDNDVDLDGLNNTLNFLLTNDFDGPDFNESFDANFLPDDNLESPEKESNESVTTEANGSVANSSVNLFEILAGKQGNNTPNTGEIVDRLSTLNKSLTDEFLNVSMGLGAANNNDVDLDGLNNTLNFLLTNDFNAADFNESFDAGFLPGDSVGKGSWNDTSLNGSNELGSSNISSLNESLDLGSLNSSCLNKSLDLGSLNISSLNESLDLGSLNSSSLNESLDLGSLNSSSLNESLDLGSLNSSSLNESLDLGSLNSSSLNESLDLGSLNSANLNMSLEFGLLNGSSLNETLDLASSNNTSLNESRQLVSSNKSNSVNISSISPCELASNRSVDGGVSTISSGNKSSDLKSDIKNETAKNRDILLDKSNQTAVNGSSSLLNTTDTVIANGSPIKDSRESEFDMFLNGTLKLGALNGTLVNNTAGGLKNNSSVTPVSGTSANSSKEGGMEKRLSKESPDLGLALSDDETHFIGSSGEEIQPVSYNDDADKDVEKVAEMVSEGNYTNRKVLEKCNLTDVCPALSQCLDVGCGGTICFCLAPYGPSKDRLSCIPEANPPVSCDQLSSYEDIASDTSFADTVPVVVATTLVCLGLALVLIVIFIYMRLNL